MKGHINNGIKSGHYRVVAFDHTCCSCCIHLSLSFKNDRVKEATFQTDGCGSSTVCGSFAAELALGKNPDELAAVAGETILEILGACPKKSNTVHTWQRKRFRRHWIIT